MKTYKDFKKHILEILKKDREEQVFPENGSVGPDGVPCLYIDHGDHSDWHDDSDIEQGKIGPDGLPTLFLDQYNIPLHRGQRIDKHLRESENKTYFQKNENDHIGETYDHVAKVLNSHQIRKEGEHGILHDHTAGSRMANKELWRSYHAGTKPPTRIGSMTSHETNVEKLDKAVGRNELKQPLHVYTGISTDPRPVIAKHEGIYHIPAYSSTSIKPEVARNFAAQQTATHPELERSLKKEGMQGHILHIHLHKGMKGAFVDKETKYKQEHEFLMPRDTSLKITHSTAEEDEFGDKYWVHHARVVPLETVSKKKKKK